jgi:hypothetical protein
VHVSDTMLHGRLAPHHVWILPHHPRSLILVLVAMTAGTGCSARGKECFVKDMNCISVVVVYCILHCRELLPGRVCIHTLTLGCAEACG